MFGLGKRDERAVEAVREEMSAADTRARAVLANAMAQIESRLTNDHEQAARLQAATQAAIENLRYEVSSRPSDIGPVLEQVAAMCALVAERLEADRLERRALTEAITLLARPGITEGPSRVLGGMVMPSEVSLVEPADANETVQIYAIESVPVEHAPIRPEPIDVEPIAVRAEAPTLIDAAPVTAPVEAPVVIDLTAEERHAEEPASGTEFWSAFEKNHVESAEADEEPEVRPRQGTRLTAARRSNAGASYR